MANSVEIDADEGMRAELLDFVTYRISQLHPKLNAQAAHILRKQAGLSLVQWRIIALIEVFGPDVCSAHIVQQAQMDKGLFSRALKVLIQDTAVISKVDPTDNRRLLLSLSAKGRKIQSTVIQTMRARQAHLMHDITPAERSALFSALAKLEKNAARKDF